MANQRDVATRHPISFRILHELIIVSIILLIITGFYIHRPFVGGAGFLMSLTRGVHFFFAAILIISVVARIISMFVGKDRDWNSFIPTWSDIKLIPRTMAYYAYLSKEPELTKKYNPLQMISYCFVFILIIFQIISGLALNYPDGAFSWFNYGLFNNEIQVRIAHFVVTWLLVMFIMIHLYLSIREKFSEIKEMHLLTSTEEGEETAKE
jgi:Ni/Fe-hydrogenase 1 B-type cytochrome subunit